MADSNALLHPSPARLTPQRRSPRLSGLPEIPPIEDIPSRPLTPDNEGFIQDEPPSVLASRIMRAHGNPSPPPQSPENSGLVLSLPFPLIPTAEDSSYSTPSATPPPEPQPLISLESSTLLPDASDTPTTSRSTILDQSLSINIPAIFPAPTDVADEQAVIDALVDEAEVSSDARETSDPPTPKPLRRSNRPRRSTARYSSPIRDEDLDFDTYAQTKPNSPRKTISLVPYPDKADPPPPLPLFDQPTRSRSRSRSPSRKSAQNLQSRRELGSLSPSSVTILKSLLPPATSPLREREQIPEEPEPGPSSTGGPAFSFSTPLPDPAPPIRFTSPIRRASPNKFHLQPADLDDPNRTPARRIPIQAAVANGQISAQKGARLLLGSRRPDFGASTTTSGSIMSSAMASPSPPRRVLLRNVSSPTKKPSSSSSPVRSRSVEPRPAPAEPPHPKKRSESVEPVLSRSKASPSPFSRSNSVERPHPHTSHHAQPPHPYPTISEEGPDPGPSTSGQQNQGGEGSQRSPVRRPGTASAEKEKSRITGKQTTSKIPRIGVKPYARPTASSAPKVSKQVDNKQPQSESSSLIKPKPLNTSTHGRFHTPSSMIPISSPVKQRVLAPSTPTPAASTSTSLKRKRGPESSLSSSSSSTSSPTKTKSVPVVLLAAPKRLIAGTTSQAPSPLKKQQLRIVSQSDGVVPNRTGATLQTSSSAEPIPPPPPPPPLTKLRLVSESDGVLPDRSKEDSEPEPAVPPIATMSQPVIDIPSSSPVQEQEEGEDAEKGLPLPPITPTPAPSPLDSSESEFTFRRSTRNSRNATTTTDSRPSRPRPPPSARRKNVPTFTDTGPFSGMTAVALRTLTDSNTTKNKEYLTALLQTEVIRREGARPESPGMNVKSVMQKEQEARTKERAERAERRAKRDAKDKDKTGDENNGASEGEDENDEWDSSPTPNSRKHVWGPGDEEDYETPLRPMKRLRIDDVADDQGQAEAEAEAEEKRVKWDRGLYSQIYLDEIQPRSTHARIAQESIKKGCLAPTAKARTLDTLGNLPNTDSPLKDLVQENVVVKKFVYDSDVVELEPVAPMTIKTRSKSKKSKS